MLHYLDVMIGFAFTMLVLSLTITALVQAVPVYLGNLKADALQRGLTDLLVRITPELRDHAAIVVETLLRDPLLSQVPGRAGAARKRASVIQREEFVRLLLDFAANNELESLQPAREKVREMLKNSGIPDPSAMLANLRNRIAELERDKPEMSAGQRSNQAMLELFLAGPGRDLMGKLTGWYDQTIDRIDGAYTRNIRGWTVGLSALLVLVLQLDALQLLSRLNTDPVLRQQAVAAAMARTGDPVTDARMASDAVRCRKEHLGRIAEVQEPAKASAFINCMGLEEAVQVDLVKWPRDWADWLDDWGDNWAAILFHLVGMLLSMALLTLGAPFWFELLKDMIKLRSTIAGKEDKARSERQASQVT